MSDILNETPLYHRGPYQPDWFEQVDAAGGIAVSSDRGSNPLNEWYGFRDRKQAIEYIGEYFTSSSFVDRHAWVTELEDFYPVEDTYLDVEEGINRLANTAAKPSYISDMVSDEGMF